MFAQGSFIQQKPQDMTPESLERRREAIRQAMSGVGRARTVGEGWTDLAQGILGGLAGAKLNVAEAKLDKEKRAKEAEDRAWQMEGRDMARQEFQWGAADRAADNAWESRTRGWETEDRATRKAGESAAQELFSTLWGGGAETPAAGSDMPGANDSPEQAAMRTGGGPSNRASTALRLQRKLEERGMPRHIATGFVLNMNDESGLNAGINEANPIVPGSRGGYGLYQLTGPRRKAFERFADQRGVSYDDEDAQLDFALMEFNSTEARAKNALMQTQTPGEAAAVITEQFLRPAQEHRERRVATYRSLDGQGYEQPPAYDGPDIDTLRQAYANPFMTPAQRQIIARQMDEYERANDPSARRESILQQQQIRQNELAMQPQAPEPTDDMREYQYAKEQGFEGTFQDYLTGMKQAGASNVSVSTGPGEVGRYIYGSDAGVPAGWRVDTQSGEASPIPGGPAAVEQEQAAAAQGRAGQSAAVNEQTRSDVVSQTTGRIRGLLDGGGPLDIPEVGIIGNKLQGWNQESADMAGLLDTLKGTVVFDRLEKLKQASATGASGLGQVTEREISLLGAQLGALDQSLSPDLIRTTLDTVEDVFGKLSPQAQQYLTGQTDAMPQGAPAAPAGPPPRVEVTPEEQAAEGDFDAFAKNPAVQSAAERYGVTVQEMWEMKNGGGN